MSMLLAEENKIMSMNRNDMDDLTKTWHDMARREILKRRMVASAGLGTDRIDRAALENPLGAAAATADAASPSWLGDTLSTRPPLKCTTLPPWSWPVTGSLRPWHGEQPSRRTSSSTARNAHTSTPLLLLPPRRLWVIGAFSLIGIIFVPIGLASLSASQEIVELVDRYDEECVTASDKIGFIQDSKANKACTRKITVPKPMKGPIHVYYQLENFYQNHRRYVQSRSDQQLRDKDYKDPKAVAKACDPEATTGDGSLIVPCGLIAWSLFNDTYAFSVNKKSVTVNKKDIAWASDKNSKFGSNVFPVNFQKGGLIGGGNLNDKLPVCDQVSVMQHFLLNLIRLRCLVCGFEQLSEQEDLIVWMRTAALPTFRKLYGRIEADIMASDEITVVIQNNYNTYSFGGTKAVVLSTASWIGGKNNFIGVAYVAVGGICLLLAMGFVVLYVVKPRALGDPAYLSWNKEAAEYSH
ncbi:ALA-interacting subunit 1 [Triticum urartu]|uniref:ALA-interacting subunit 1 n=2 Tax=Triticum TaxID=4564 RepID=M7ZL38_TRIUA|nr:ALA-interacting subunit 1 [Triticum urartu]